MDYKKLYNDLYDSNYFTKKDTGEIGNYIQVLEEIDRLKLNYNTVLDVGCAIGNILVLLEDKQCSGIDISERAVEISNERKLNVTQGSILDIPHSDNSFDMVFSVDVLEHLIEDDLEKAVNELFRVSSKYVAVKIATIAECDRTAFNAVKKKTSEYNNIKNLHMSIFKNKKWEEIFNKVGHNFLVNKVYNTFVLYVCEKI